MGQLPKLSPFSCSLLLSCLSLPLPYPTLPCPVFVLSSPALSYLFPFSFCSRLCSLAVFLGMDNAHSPTLLRYYSSVQFSSIPYPSSFTRRRPEASRTSAQIHDLKGK
jgi:hypothetical protein